MIASDSELITFLDNDDLRLSGSLDRQIKALEARPDVGMIYGGTFYGDQDYHPQGGPYSDKYFQGDVFWQLTARNVIPCSTVVFRRECLLKVGLLDESAPGIEDWDLWVRIGELYPMLAIKEPVAIRRHSTPSSGQFTHNVEKMHR